MWPVSTNELLLRENKRQRLQAKIDAQKDSLRRNQLGQYATPFQLAMDIANVAVKLWQERADKIAFLDPGFGSGAFLSALYHVVSEEMIESAVGIEIDSAFSAVAQELWADTPFTAQILQADFTRLEPPQKPTTNLIICNPPYIRHHHMSSEQKERLQTTVQDSLGLTVNGLAGMYCYFLLLAHRWLAPKGLAVWLIPTEFMEVNYGQVIRQYLTERVTLLHLHRFEAIDVQFADALVSSAIVVFENTEPTPDHKVEFTVGGTLSSPNSRYFISVGELTKECKWTRSPKKRSARSQVEITFQDLFTTRRGLATGANSYFILTRAKAHALDLPKEFLKPILPSPRYVRGDIIRSDDEDLPLIHPQMVLVDCELPEESVRDNYPALWEYFELGRRLGIDQRYLASKRTPWYRQERLAHSPFLCTYMGRPGRNGASPFRFLWNQSQATVPNVYLLVYPRESVQSIIDCDIEWQAQIFELLSHIRINELVEQGRTYGGGLHKIEPRELYRVNLTENPFAREIVAAIRHE